MARCFEEAKRLGRSIRFGDTGPRLLTRLSLESGREHGALSNILCYPIHHSRALDALRPSHSTSLREQTASALFVHLWNATLLHYGVWKSHLPPQGSLLRQWAEQHPVDGWTGEYDEQALSLALATFEENRRLKDALHLQKREYNDFLLKNDELTAKLAAVLTEAERVRDEILMANQRISASLIELTAENASLHAQIASMLNSISWRITSPLRSKNRFWDCIRLHVHRRR